MSDTPITDFEKQTLEEWIKEYDGLMIPEEDKKPWYLVHEVTAKKLERERDEAREECKAIAEKLDGIKRLCDKIEEKADWFREKAGQHLEERDEARKTAERYRIEANAMMLQRYEEDR